MKMFLQSCSFIFSWDYLLVLTVLLLWINYGVGPICWYKREMLWERVREREIEGGEGEKERETRERDR